MKERRMEIIYLKLRLVLITCATCHLIGNIASIDSMLFGIGCLFVQNLMIRFFLNFRYEASYVDKLPEYLQGQEFLNKYVNHEDSVTVIDKKHTYAVRAPTRHPIYENFRVKVSFYYTP